MTNEQIIAQYPGYATMDPNAIQADFQATQGQGKGGGGSSSGSSNRYVGGIDYSQVPSVQNFVGGQLAGEDAALKEYLMAMKARKSPMDIYSGLELEAGLPTLRGTATTLSKEIGGLEDTLGTIEPNIAARTRESLVTEAMRQRMVQSEKEPLWEKLSKFTTNLGRIGDLIGLTSGDIANKTQLFLQGQEQELEPYKIKYTSLISANARKLTGFTEDRQTWLELKLDQVNRNRELSDQDWAQVNQIASEKRAYTKSLQQTAASMGFQVQGNETDENLLSVIGQKAGEEIAYNRRQTGKGTQTDRDRNQATMALRNDVMNGALFEDVSRRYQGVLEDYEIRQIYNEGQKAREGGGYGPAKEPESTVQSWQLKPTKTTSSGTDTPDFGNNK